MSSAAERRRSSAAERRRSSAAERGQPGAAERRRPGAAAPDAPGKAASGAPGGAAPAHACGVCGAPARPPFRAPPPELAPDLDLRPGEPTRSTLARWVQECRSCRACAPDLAALPSGARAVVESDSYRAVDGPAEARRLLRWAMVAERLGDRAAAAEAVLQAAWAADDRAESGADANAAAEAAALRRRAAALWGDPADAEAALRLVDVLRRAGDFAAAEARAAALAGQGLDESSARILAYQRARVAERDSGRHLISSALRPPARTPHVTHGPRKEAGPRGFWRRLLGG